MNMLSMYKKGTLSQKQLSERFPLLFITAGKNESGQKRDVNKWIAETPSLQNSSYKDKKWLKY